MTLHLRKTFQFIKIKIKMERNLSQFKETSILSMSLQVSKLKEGEKSESTK